MNVTKSTQPNGAQAAAVQLEQVRARIRAAQGAVEEARRAAAAAAEAGADAALLRRRLPVVTAAADDARRGLRGLQGIRPASLWYGVRGSLGHRRAGRTDELAAALAERDALVVRISEQLQRVEALRTEAARHRAAAAALPRLLDEAASFLRVAGGPAAEALVAAEAGLDPVLRREADLDQAARWTRWAQLHVEAALDRLGPARTWGSYDAYFAALPFVSVTEAGARVEAARSALAGVRDVLTVLRQALDDLGVAADAVLLGGLTLDVPGDLDDWFADVSHNPVRQAQVAAALEEAERYAAIVVELRDRVYDDHASSRKVLQVRRAHWCAVLRGE